jgi:hypothetical protein
MLREPRQHHGQCSAVISKTGGINAVTPGDGNISVTAGNVTTVGGTGIQRDHDGAGQRVAEQQRM